MSRLARFRVMGPRLDGARGATLEIDRETGVVQVRPFRRRYVASVTLSWVAEAALLAEGEGDRAEKRARKRARRAS